MSREGVTPFGSGVFWELEQAPPRTTRLKPVTSPIFFTCIRIMKGIL
jgi:hypothetical protein